MLEVLKDIHKNFGRKKVLKGVSFTADKGDITCLIGINGVGNNDHIKFDYGSHAY